MLNVQSSQKRVMPVISAQESTFARKQIILVSITGIFLSLLVTSLILGIPYYNDIKNNLNNNLQLLTKNKAIQLTHQLYRYRSQANSISQRIHATRLLAKYDQGAINLTQFSQKSSTILQEAINQTEDIAGLIRLSKQHIPLLELGKTVPVSYWQSLTTSTPGININDPKIITLNGNNLLLLTSNITNHSGERIGTDIVIIDPQKLSHTIKPDDQDNFPVTSKIFSALNGTLELLLPRPHPDIETDTHIKPLTATILQDKQNIGDSAREIGNQVITHAPIANSSWIISVSTEKNYLYKDIKHKVISIGLELLIISLLAATVMLKVMKPLSHKVVKHSEQKLQETEERFRLLVENTNDWIWEINEKNQYTYSSPSIRTILGYSNTDIIGHTPFEFMAENESARIAKIFHNLSTTKQPIHNLENINLHKDGHKVTLETSAVPYFSDTGEYKGYRGVDRDITSRKAIEKELAKYRSSLELKVKQRTSKLLELYHELESFSYTASHDLRTPLRAIDGFATALLEDNAEQLDATGKDYLSRVRMAANKMSELIDALLQLTKITRHELSLEKTSLSSLAKLSLEQLFEIDKDRNIEIKISPDLYCTCDRKLMQIALDNLISNAWKYTSTQTNPRIDFGSSTETGETTYFIKDNGVGFDIRYADKIFEPFQRLHNDSDFTGTGIGLATVQRIIMKHGGKIWVSSSLNQGATFYFTLGPSNNE